MKFTVSHTWPVREDDFWSKVFFDEEYNKRLYKEGLQFPGFEVLELKHHPDGSWTRRQRIEPKADAPAVVKKLIGDSLSYLEEGKWDPKTRRWTYKITTSKLSDKISISGEFWVEKRGDVKIERFCSCEVTVKIFGVGGTIESFIEKSTRDSYEQTARFTEKFIAEKGLSK